MLLENTVLLHWGFSDPVLHPLVIHQKHVVTEPHAIILVFCHDRSIILSLRLMVIWNIVIILWRVSWQRLPQKWGMLSLHIHQFGWLLCIVEVFGLLPNFLRRVLHELSNRGLALVKSSQLLRGHLSLRILHVILLHLLFFQSLCINRPTLLTNCSSWSVSYSIHWLESLVIYDFWLIIILLLLNDRHAWVILRSLHRLLLRHIMLFKWSLGLKVRLVVVKRM